MDKTFNMKGFNAVTKSPFTVEGFVYPPPALSSVDPVMLKLNSGAFTLTANGAGFVDAYSNGSGTVPGSKVRWDNSERTTTFVSANKLTASIPASDAAVEGVHQVTVVNPSPGGGSSNPVPVMVDGSPPVIAFSTNPAQIRQANPNLLVSVTVSGSIKDALSGVDPATARFSVVDQYAQYQPSGPITLNPDGTFSFVIRLSGALNKKDPSRTYTIKIDASDKLGFAASKVVTLIATK
jgi:hypothetical protein